MKKSFLSIMMTGLCVAMAAQNPVIHDQFTADPSARVFGDTLYLYCSHDIPAPDDYERKDWFCMHDYHVFSTTDLVHWKDYGVQFTEDDVPWVKHRSYSMWAPDCVFANGKYLFYFPAVALEAEKDEIFGVGIAESDSPCGPFHPTGKRISGVKGIDPCVFIDSISPSPSNKGGVQAYIYWAQDGIHGAKLKENMSELDGEGLMLAPNTPGAYKEGPFVFKRNGIYYLTYPLQVSMSNGSSAECLAYSTSKSPLGPFEYRGRIMDIIPEPYCWTNHHSIVQYRGQWYLFYHHNDYDPKMEMHRSVRIDSLKWNPDGTIQKVVPSFRGVGVTDATSEIQIDRYSYVKGNPVVDFVNPDQPFQGWFVRMNKQGQEVIFNSVYFQKKKYKQIIVRYRNNIESNVSLSVSDTKTEIHFPFHSDWTTLSFPLNKKIEGIRNISLLLDSGNIDIDWIRFE